MSRYMTAYASDMSCLVKLVSMSWLLVLASVSHPLLTMDAPQWATAHCGFTQSRGFHSEREHYIYTKFGT